MQNKTFRQLVDEDIRLVVLKMLAEDPDYSHNEFVLKSALGMLGHKVSSDHLRVQLSWLSEQGLIATSEVEHVIVAKLTARGADAASGAATVPGVKRPEPGL